MGLSHFFEDKRELENFIIAVKPGTNPCYFRMVDCVRSRGFEFELWWQAHPNYPEDGKFILICPEPTDGFCNFYEMDFLYNIDKKAIKNIHGCWGIGIIRFRVFINDVLFHLGNGMNYLTECVEHTLHSHLGYPYKQWKTITHEHLETQGIRFSYDWKVIKELTLEEFCESHTLNKEYAHAVNTNSYDCHTIITDDKTSYSWEWGGKHKEEIILKDNLEFECGCDECQNEEIDKQEDKDKETE